MGYQRVDICFADGKELKNIMVFNAEELEIPDECGSRIKSISLAAKGERT